MRISDWSSDVCSSDLAAALRVGIEILGVALSAGPRTAAGDGSASLARPMTAVRVAFIKLRALVRSEEHTSELQSLMRISYAVFCLKKKTTIPRSHNHSSHSSYPTVFNHIIITM